MSANSSEKCKEGEVNVEMAQCGDEGQLFQCSICWDLAYKPVVHACGHLFCFWCVHLAMSNFSDSQCPICRRTYGHFPRVCEMLHFLLLKMLPDDYQRREREVQVLEEEREASSPQFGQVFSRKVEESVANMDGNLTSELLLVDHVSGSGRTLEQIPFTAVETATVNTEGNPVRNGDAILTSKVPASHDANINSNGANIAITEDIASKLLVDTENLLFPIEDTRKAHFSEQGEHKIERFSEDNSTCQQVCDAPQVGEVGCSKSPCSVSISDALCNFCHQLLCQPVVLNCGHAFCQACLAYSEDGRLICSSCRSLHREQYADVCLELHFYLERAFPIEYKQRVQAVDPTKSLSQTTASGRLSLNKDGKQQGHWEDRGGPIHSGVGCDGCGMYPIYGKRFFHCSDCPSIGYDLCESCYTIGQDLPGRFNQHHTKDHQMVEMAFESAPLAGSAFFGIILMTEALHESE